MSKTLPFDTLLFANRLQAKGMQKELADELAELTANAISDQQSELATKSDLRELEYRIIIKLGGMLTVVIGVIVTLVKLI